MAEDEREPTGSERRVAALRAHRGPGDPKAPLTHGVYSLLATGAIPCDERACPYVDGFEVCPKRGEGRSCALFADLQAQYVAERMTPDMGADEAHSLAKEALLEAVQQACLAYFARVSMFRSAKGGSIDTQPAMKHFLTAIAYQERIKANRLARRASKQGGAGDDLARALAGLPSARPAAEESPDA